MILPCKTARFTYDIVIERGCLSRAAQHMTLSRRVCLVTDDGVPPQYAAAVAAQCAQPLIVTLPQGEATKTLSSMQEICRRMLSAGFDRHDCVVAVGGGVVGDLAGFAAACYMRGIDFYNVPTTLLAQVDSSVGGKTAVDLDGAKNIIGAFYPPRAVLIDPDVLSTLPPEQFSGGMAEAIKMSVTSDPALFSLIETQPVAEHIEQIIEGALRIKRGIVEQDERESGLRMILNFGHTLGHGIETGSGLTLTHGACVALGMPAFCSAEVRARLLPVLKKVGLPTAVSFDPERVWQAMLHDKKFSGSEVSVVLVQKLGQGEIRHIGKDELRGYLDTAAAICRAEGEGHAE